MKKNLVGRITISRPRGNSDDEPYINVSIRDDASRTSVIEVRVPLASFTEALTGLAEVLCEMDFFADPERLGKQMETKTVLVEDKSPYGITSEEYQAHWDDQAAPHIEGGWIACPPSLKGGRTQTRNGRYPLIFRRWVEKEGGAK